MIGLPQRRSVNYGPTVYGSCCIVRRKRRSMMDHTRVRIFDNTPPKRALRANRGGIGLEDLSTQLLRRGCLEITGERVRGLKERHGRPAPQFLLDIFVPRDLRTGDARIRNIRNCPINRRRSAPFSTGQIEIATTRPCTQNGNHERGACAA